MFHKIDDIARSVGRSQTARGDRQPFNLPGLVQEGENFVAKALGGEFRFRNHTARARTDHRLRVA